jgi:hypothetical protein
MTDEEKLEKTAIKAFKQHWTKIARSLEEGKNTYATKRYDCFEADTSARQKILANRFYGLDHARKMATLSEKAIKRNLSCYLPKAIEYALSEHEDEPSEQEAFIKELVDSEYVIFRSNQWVSIEGYDEDTHDFYDVAKYPGDAYYGDWYEGSVGAEAPVDTSILMKSTGEIFLKIEVDWLKGSIRQNIDGNEFLAFWWFQCEPLTKNKLWITINDLTTDKEHKERYVDDFLYETAILSKNQLQKFVCQMIERLHNEPEAEEEKEKFKKALSVFNNYRSMKKQDLFNTICSFFWKNWEPGVLSDYDIRIAEKIMNSIAGRKDRDYHSGITF